MKNIEWLKEKINKINPFIQHTWTWKKEVLDLIDQLDEQEITEEEFAEYAKENNWIVRTPEQMFRFQKSIEELNEQKEPETVASVMADFYKSLERLREVLAIEVEDLEE